MALILFYWHVHVHSPATVCNMRAHKTLQLNPLRFPRVVKWDLVVVHSDKCAQIIKCPAKMNLSAKEGTVVFTDTQSCWRSLAALQGAVRKAAERLSSSLGGFIHVVDTYASSKMRTDKLNMSEKVWAACGKTPCPSSEEGSSPSQRPYVTFRGPLSVKKLPRLRLVNKLLGRDAHGKKRTCNTTSALQQTGSSAAEKCKSGTITQQQTRQEQWSELRVVQSASPPTNNARRACRRPFLGTGGKLQKRPVQIRHDGFIICLKCQLLQKPFLGLHSQIEALNF